LLNMSLSGRGASWGFSNFPVRLWFFINKQNCSVSESDNGQNCHILADSCWEMPLKTIVQQLGNVKRVPYRKASAPASQLRTGPQLSKILYSVRKKIAPATKLLLFFDRAAREKRGRY
jgi:hypothetical protein